MKRTSQAQQGIDTKLLSNRCEFAKIILDRRQQETHTCPVCDAFKEDRNHIFTCQGPAAKNNWENLNKLKKKMENLNTAPIIT